MVYILQWLNSYQCCCRVVGQTLLVLVKGFKVGKTNHNMDLIERSKSNFSHLEGIFMKNPLNPEPSPIITKEVQGAVELDIGYPYIPCFFKSDTFLSLYIGLYSISVVDVPLTEDLLLTQMILKLMTLSLWLLLHLIAHKIVKEVTCIKSVICSFRIHNNKYFPCTLQELKEGSCLILRVTMPSPDLGHVKKS